MSSTILDVGAEIADQAVLDQVATHVRSVLRSRIGSLRIVLSQEGIILHGNAYSYYGKQLAQHAIIKATRLPIVANQIRVA